MNMKYKITIDTDGDISEKNTKPFLMKSDFEKLSSDFLKIDDFKILLLASLLMVKFLPKYYGDYHLKDLVDFAEKLFKIAKSGDKNILDEDFRSLIIENKVLRTFVVDFKETLDSVKEIVKYYMREVHEFEFYYFDIGNQVIMVEKIEEYEEEKVFEKVIIDVLKEELVSVITYEDCKKIAFKIKNEIKKRSKNGFKAN